MARHGQNANRGNIMDRLKGVVEGTYGEGKEFKFKVEGTWFSNSYATNVPNVNRGDTVVIMYQNNPKFKGQFWKSVEVVKDDEASSSAPSNNGGSGPAVAAPKHYTTAKGYLTKVQSFPVPMDHPDTSIIRQNALTNAVKWSGGNTVDVENIIRVARQFEAYTSGQLDAEEQAEAKRAIDNEFGVE
jgi:hypothetical protein